MFGIMLKSTHRKVVDGILETHSKQLGVLREKLEAERRAVETLQGRIARRDTSIATLSTDKAAVENELRLANGLISKQNALDKAAVLAAVKSAPTPAAKPAPGKAKAEAPKSRKK